MFISLLIGSLAVVAAFAQLGAVTVKLSVITLALKAALAAIAILVGLFGLMLWQGRFKAS